MNFLLKLWAKKVTVSRTTAPTPLVGSQAVRGQASEVSIWNYKGSSDPRSEPKQDSDGFRSEAGWAQSKLLKHLQSLGWSSACKDLRLLTKVDIAHGTCVWTSLMGKVLAALVCQLFLLVQSFYRFSYFTTCWSSNPKWKSWICITSRMRSLLVVSMF